MIIKNECKTLQFIEIIIILYENISYCFLRNLKCPISKVLIILSATKC